MSPNRWLLKWPKRAIILQPYAIPVEFLRIVWIGVICYFELGTFKHHVSDCAWPEVDSQSLSTSLTHVLVLADPQILDSRSYPGRHPWLMWLSQLLVDVNMRKSWNAALHLRPDAVVFLGDMMDGGRRAISDPEYEAYYQRFRKTFRINRAIPTYYLPGNHDIGLGTSSTFSDSAAERYIAHFGALNQEIDIGGHSCLLIDAPGFVEEDEERSSSGMTYAQWAEDRPEGTIAFVRAISTRQLRNSPILFTHIPLSRPHGASCGPLREHGTIRSGRGHGYQNTLSVEASIFLLQSLHPSLVLSGDDHDYCEFVHQIPAGGTPPPNSAAVREVTVRSFSMAMGVRRPGFQLLSLAVPTFSSASPNTLADASCMLPDQLWIYLSIYVPLIIISLLTLLVSNIHRVRTRKRFWTLWDVRDEPLDPDAWLSTAPSEGRDADEDEKLFSDEGLPPSDSAFSHRPSRFTRNAAGLKAELWYWRDKLHRGRSKMNAWRIRAGFAYGFARDVVELAVAPLLIFVAITWWHS